MWDAPATAAAIRKPAPVVRTPRWQTAAIRGHFICGAAPNIAAFVDGSPRSTSGGMRQRADDQTFGDR
jgi:hypothetical protein